MNYFIFALKFYLRYIGLTLATQNIPKDSAYDASFSNYKNDYSNDEALLNPPNVKSSTLEDPNGLINRVKSLNPLCDPKFPLLSEYCKGVKIINFKHGMVPEFSSPGNGAFLNFTLGIWILKLFYFRSLGQKLKKNDFFRII